MSAWDIPAEDSADQTRQVTITAATGALTLELRDFDGFVSATHARRIALALNQAALELDGCVLLDDTKGSA